MAECFHFSQVTLQEWECLGLLRCGQPASGCF